MAKDLWSWPNTYRQYCQHDDGPDQIKNINIIDPDCPFLKQESPAISDKASITTILESVRYFNEKDLQKIYEQLIKTGLQSGHDLDCQNLIYRKAVNHIINN